MNSKKIILTNKIHAEKFDIVEKSDNYAILTSDIGKCMVLTGATGKTFTFDTFSSAYNGSRIRCMQSGTGELKIAPYTGGTINNSEYILCKYQHGIVELMLIDTDTWIVVSTDGRII